MSNGQQNDGLSILPEYTVDNLGISFKVILVNSVECSVGSEGPEISIPDFQGLMKKVAITRAAHPLKLKGGDVRFLRKTLGLKGKDLASRLDITPEHLSRCETGEKVLSTSSEKVLRTLVLVEALYVLQKALEDHEVDAVRVQGKITSLLSSVKNIISDLKISSVSRPEEELILYFRRESILKAANDHGVAASEWLDEAA
jgi:DNA-binding transcriptional regulator YiaG